VKKTCALGALIALASCSGPAATASYQTSASYDRLYTSALSAVQSVGFTVTSSNKADGLITAQQGVVLGKGSAVGLNVMVSNDSTARHLQVNFKAPPATFALGNFDQNVADYISAVKRGVPDLRASAP
jgi:hypothetical protein